VIWIALFHEQTKIQTSGSAAYADDIHVIASWNMRGTLNLQHIIFILLF
jgi:hypothetical protein